jgi:hypothetical protein
MPSHRFLRLLLSFHDLELHHLTPSGILHIAAFVTLCEAYMGVKPHFNQWNFFFRIRLRPGSDTEAGRMAERMVFLRNDANTLLPTFMGNHPVPQPN